MSGVRCLLVAAAAALLAAACDDEPDPCELIAEHHESCGIDLGVEDPSELECGDDPTNACVANCITSTSCDDLRACSGVGPVGDECPPSYDACLQDCI